MDGCFVWLCEVLRDGQLRRVLINLFLLKHFSWLTPHDTWAITVHVTSGERRERWSGDVSLRYKRLLLLYHCARAQLYVQFVCMNRGCTEWLLPAIMMWNCYLTNAFSFLFFFFLYFCEILTERHAIRIPAEVWLHMFLILTEKSRTFVMVLRASTNSQFFSCHNPNILKLSWCVY